MPLLFGSKFGALEIMLVLLILLVWAGTVVILFAAIRFFGRRNARRDAVKIAEERCAMGEITQEQLEEIKRNLGR